MENKIGASFDFDGTLTRPSVQEYAKMLIKRDVIVFICTSRYSDDYNGYSGHNDDIYEIAKIIGIPNENIIFTERDMDIKDVLLKSYGDELGIDFKFHLDDDNITLTQMQRKGLIKPVFLFNNPMWEVDCNYHINKK